MHFPHIHPDFEGRPPKHAAEHDASEEIAALRNQIFTLERSLGEGFAPNTSTAEGEIRELKQKLNDLEHNPVRNLFQKPKGADNQVAL